VSGTRKGAGIGDLGSSLTHYLEAKRKERGHDENPGQSEGSFREGKRRRGGTERK